MQKFVLQPFKSRFVSHIHNHMPRVYVACMHGSNDEALSQQTTFARIGYSKTCAIWP
jgi:hypothetical protein